MQEGLIDLWALVSFVALFIITMRALMIADSNARARRRRQRHTMLILRALANTREPVGITLLARGDQHLSLVNNEDLYAAIAELHAEGYVIARWEAAS